jgi:hypothetical protein
MVRVELGLKHVTSVLRNLREMTESVYCQDGTETTFFRSVCTPGAAVTHKNNFDQSDVPRGTSLSAGMQLHSTDVL